MRLTIHTLRNEVLCWLGEADGSDAAPVVHRFTRRWEALFLGLLLTSARAGSEVSGLQLLAEARRRGQTVALNRAQMQRLLHNLQTFLDTLPGGAWTLWHPPRKHTVGPWRLRIPASSAAGLRVEIDDQPPEPGPDTPALCALQDTDALAHWLGQLLAADAMAVGGQYADAIEVAERLCGQPMRPEAQSLLWLRLAHWHRLRGHFEAARQGAAQALALANPNDPGIAPFARMTLMRIDYDENPAAAWEALWFASAQPPAGPSEHSAAVPDPDAASAHTQADWRTLADWHNLRALVARRRMLALAERGHAHPDPADQPAALHQTALRHFQAALYMAAWHRDWDRLQAVVANLAYHLQAALPLADALHIRVDQVMRWHRLTMDYEDKLGAGRDTAWEYIFFGRFWLDHQQALGPADAQDPIAHNLQNTGPDQEAFYIKAVQRLRECGDARQVAIGLTLYLRFVQEHLSDPRRQARVRKRLSQQLSELLQSQPNRHLLSGLHQEGYTSHWPPALREALGA